MYIYIWISNPKHGQQIEKAIKQCYGKPHGRPREPHENIEKLRYATKGLLKAAQASFCAQILGRDPNHSLNNASRTPEATVVMAMNAV